MEYIISVFLLLFGWRLAKYISTPLLKKIGFYKYYSPMFLTVSIFPGRVEIHLGTSWDFFKHRKITPKLLLGYLAEGLVNLCEDIENGTIPENKLIQGNIHYLKSSTTKKFGFNTRNYNFFEFILFLLNYIELCILKTISYGRPSIVRLQNNKIHYCRAKDLVKNKSKYFEYLRYLKQSSSDSVQLMIIKKCA